MITSRDRESDQIEKQQNKKIKTLGLGFVKFATRQRECGTTAFGQRERGGGMRERESPECARILGGVCIQLSFFCLYYFNIFLNF